MYNKYNFLKESAHKQEKGQREKEREMEGEGETES